jgi:pimeloyl-ACP methyl ester carboxylesterase
MQGALTATLQGLGGTDWKDLVASTGPDAFAMAIRDTTTYYRYEGPSLQRWTLDPNRASAISCPLLSVLGDASDEFFVQGRALLLHQHFPQCTDVDIPNANHLLNLQAPQSIAKAIAEFLPRGPESACHHR